MRVRENYIHYIDIRWVNVELTKCNVYTVYGECDKWKRVYQNYRHTRGICKFLKTKKKIFFNIINF